MVNPNGTATVSYPDGCKVNVRPGEVTTIAPSSPCSSPYAAQQPPPPQQPVADPPSDSTALALGAAGVGLGAAALGVGIYAISQHNSNTTVNPMTCGTAANPCFTSH